MLCEAPASGLLLSSGAGAAVLRVRVPDPAPLWPEIALFLLPGENTVLHQSHQARAPPGHGEGPVRGRAEAEEEAREEVGRGAGRGRRRRMPPPPPPAGSQ